MECRKCKKPFKNRVFLDGQWKNICNRKYCLECSPWKSHNTKADIDAPKKIKKLRNAEQVSEWRRKSKLKLIDYKGGKCQRCGYNKAYPSVYQFHHRDPKEKDFGIGSGCVQSFEKMKTEADKCDMLCRNCHAEVHEELLRKK
jgi:hypothetical protein